MVMVTITVVMIIMVLMVKKKLPGAAVPALSDNTMQHRLHIVFW